MDSPIERICRYCNQPIPEGTAGRYCSLEHQLLDRTRRPTMYLSNGLKIIGLAILAWLPVVLLVNACCAQEIGTTEALLCDTPEQVETVITGHDRVATMSQVNDDAGTAACALGHFSAIKGAIVKEIPAEEGLVDIMQIMVVGYYKDDKFILLDKALLQFTPVQSPNKAKS